MLGVMRADTPDAFATALRGFAIPGQNMLHATRGGHVGHLLRLRRAATARAARRTSSRPPESASDWDRIATTADYPDRRDPPEGFVASANDAPPPGAVPAGFLFSPMDRVRAAARAAGRRRGGSTCRRWPRPRSTCRAAPTRRTRWRCVCRGTARRRCCATGTGATTRAPPGALAFETAVGRPRRRPAATGRGRGHRRGVAGSRDAGRAAAGDGVVGHARRRSTRPGPSCAATRDWGGAAPDAAAALSRRRAGARPALPLRRVRPRPAATTR